MGRNGSGMRRKNDILLVDGYNIIGAWPELEQLKELDLEEARFRLLEMLADYQGYTGMRVYVVFDAHQVSGAGVSFKQYKLEVVYTKEKETADECIERLCRELAARSNSIYVATSDMVEQSVAFGQGALRISARELLLDVEQAQRQVGHALHERNAGARNPLDDRVSMDVRIQLERMRRGDRNKDG